MDIDFINQDGRIFVLVRTTGMGSDPHFHITEGGYFCGSIWLVEGSGWKWWVNKNAHLYDEHDMLCMIDAIVEVLDKA